mmetsp:Transcript_91566/g.209862  ORF Transcript_91566/g.209862 Transcript_91566/m.209862 type:complete len:292 (+) Transcript_91566:2530-3405(+)
MLLTTLHHLHASHQLPGPTGDLKMLRRRVEPHLQLRPPHRHRPHAGPPRCAARPVHSHRWRLGGKRHRRRRQVLHELPVLPPRRRPSRGSGAAVLGVQLAPAFCHGDVCTRGQIGADGAARAGRDTELGGSAVVGGAQRVRGVSCAEDAAPVGVVCCQGRVDLCSIPASRPLQLHPGISPRLIGPVQGLHALAISIHHHVLHAPAVSHLSQVLHHELPGLLRVPGLQAPRPDAHAVPRVAVPREARAALAGVPGLAIVCNLVGAVCVFIAVVGAQGTLVHVGGEGEIGATG